MEERSKVHVGLDVHKDSITVGAAEAGRERGRVVGKTAHDVNKVLKMLTKLGPPEQLHIVYEAGPTGYGLQRSLQARGYVCEVIAPSQMPRRRGDRVKTDGRDGVQLAECSRAGQLRAVWVPDLADEAIRDLARAREDAGQQPHEGAPATQGILAAPWHALWRQDVVDHRVLPMAGHAQLRGGRFADCVHRVLAGGTGR